MVVILLDVFWGASTFGARFHIVSIITTALISFFGVLKIGTPANAKG